MGTLAKALLVLNALERFSGLLDTGATILVLNSWMKPCLNVSSEIHQRGPKAL